MWVNDHTYKYTKNTNITNPENVQNKIKACDMELKKYIIINCCITVGKRYSSTR